MRFTRQLFAADNPCFSEALVDAEIGDAPKRAVVFIDSGVAASWPQLRESITSCFAGPGMPTLELMETVAGGEQCKNNTVVLDRVIEAVNQHHIDRKSFVIAIGGGAMLDAVGFGAATAHRGVRLVRVPTTVLSQDDAAMGVKCGINRFGKKNFLGSFAPPWAVLCDSEFLTTQSAPHFRCGFSEAVKIALLRDVDLFQQIERDSAAIAARDMDLALPVIARSGELHLHHIVSCGDAFEVRQSRPLDFGHWAAHRLEEMSGNEVSHGDAVAIGLGLDCTISHLMGWLSAGDLDRIIFVLRRLMLPVCHPLLARTDELLAGLDEFREHLGGELCITLLRGIGQPEEVHSLDPSVVREAVRRLR